MSDDLWWMYFGCLMASNGCSLDVLWPLLGVRWMSYGLQLVFVGCLMASNGCSWKSDGFCLVFVGCLMASDGCLLDA